MIKTFKPPMNITKRRTLSSTVFLAGSIEMGKAVDWQSKLEEFLTAEWPEGLGQVVFNPRRDDWDQSWEQTYENPQFFQQVMWELNAMEKADFIIFYFQPGTMSPISLLELGLWAKQAKEKNLAVICPLGFWRRGNVEIVCDKYDIPFYNSMEEFMSDLKEKNNIAEKID